MLLIVTFPGAGKSAAETNYNQAVDLDFLPTKLSNKAFEAIMQYYITDFCKDKLIFLINFKQFILHESFFKKLFTDILFVVPNENKLRVLKVRLEKRDLAKHGAVRCYDIQGSISMVKELIRYTTDLDNVSFLDKDEYISDIIKKLVYQS